ncbi:deoxyribonuclease IV [Thermodesulfobacteriota bacterium]
MPLLGAHESISGSPYKALYSAKEKGFDVIQIFTRLNILLETTAGQGSSLGYKFDQLKTIIEKSSYRVKMGICFDTCHAFAAGYDFTSKEGYRQIIENFDNIIGLEKLKIFHINDSKTKSGSLTDRHAHPGQGCIGSEGLSFFLQDERFNNHPFIMETSKELDKDGIEMDVKNLKLLKHLSGMGITE